MDNSLNTTNRNAFTHTLDNKYLNSNTFDNEDNSRINYVQNVSIYGWGRNKNGELGLGKNALQSYINPQPIKSLRNLQVAQIASGGKHTAVLTANGKLYLCGTHILGLLGIDNKEYKDFSIFQRLATLDHEFIVQVQCAEFHTLCLTSSGQVYAWGGNLHKKLGQNNAGIPTRVIGLHNKKIIQISCGDYHSCALTDTGELYSWGGGGVSYNKGQCGHGDFKDYDTPKKVEYFKNKRVVKVVCGGYHTLVLTDDNKLYGFGKGNFGQCGYGEFEDTSLPKQVIFNRKFEMYENPFFDKKNSNAQQVFTIKDIKCGGYHSVVLSAMGRVYTFGHNMNGQLGLGDTKNHAQPDIVKSVLKKNIIQISAGWSHTFILTEQGNLYACGSGKYGELGLDDNEYRKIFIPIKKVAHLNITQVVAGGHHSWLMIDSLTPLRQEFHTPSPLPSNPGSPKKSNTPSPKQNEMTAKRGMQDSSFQNTKTKQKKDKLKLNIDLLTEKYNSEKFFLQVAFSDLKMSHRFVRFSLNNKFKDMTTKDLNRKFSDYLRADRCVEFFRLQDDSEVMALNNYGLASLYKDIKNSLRLLDGNKTSTYSLCIVYDLNKLPLLLSLKSSLEGVMKKFETKNIYEVMMIGRDDIMSNDLEKILSYWTIDFLENFSDMIDDNVKFLELRPNSFYI